MACARAYAFRRGGRLDTAGLQGAGPHRAFRLRGLAGRRSAVGATDGFGGARP